MYNFPFSSRKLRVAPSARPNVRTALAPDIETDATIASCASASGAS
jgi:hypothetical protein